MDIEINGESVALHMKLGDNGEAFFVEENESLEVRGFVMCLPLPVINTLVRAEEYISVFVYTEPHTASVTTV